MFSSESLFDLYHPLTETSGVYNRSPVVTMSSPYFTWGWLSFSIAFAHAASLPIVNHLVLVYGSNATDSPNHDLHFSDHGKQRRVEFIMRPRMPEHLKEKHRGSVKDAKAVSGPAQDVVRKVVPSLKRSQN